MATVLSMVASSCIPPIAMTAARNRRDGNHSGYQPVRSLAGCPTCTGSARLLARAASLVWPPRALRR